jgi:hypothetical protein
VCRRALAQSSPASSALCHPLSRATWTTSCERQGLAELRSWRAPDEAAAIALAIWKRGRAGSPPSEVPVERRDRQGAHLGSTNAAVERICQLQMLLQHRQRLLSEGLECGILP